MDKQAFINGYLFEKKGGIGQYLESKIIDPFYNSLPLGKNDWNNLADLYERSPLIFQTITGAIPPALYTALPGALTGYLMAKNDENKYKKALKYGLISGGLGGLAGAGIGGLAEYEYRNKIN